MTCSGLIAKPNSGRRGERSGGGYKRRDRDNRREGGKPREERVRTIQSSPSGPKGAFDPDSPFAKLSSLKAALEKRGQD